MRQPRDSVIRAWLVGLAVVLSVVLTACGSSTPASAPEPSPNLPSVPEDARSMSSASQDALYAEAEQVYRDFFAEEQKILLAGGAERIPDSVQPYVAGDFAQVTEAIYEEFHKRGWRQQQGTTAQISAIRLAEDEISEESPVVIQTCTDTRMSSIVTADGQSLPGGINYTKLYFIRDDSGNLKIWSSTDEVVNQCPIEA